MGNVFVFNHPLIKHKIAILRNKDTQTREFKETMDEITELMVYEVTKDLPLCEKEILTPLQKAKVQMLADNNITIVPILRAGLGMVEALTKLLPFAVVRHIGLYRDHDTLKPVTYYNKMPDNMENVDIIIVDPMLALGQSVCETIKILKDKNVRSIKYMCIMASEDGIKNVSNQHPDVDIFCAEVDKELNENLYIVPGLGDAGDRLFGTY